MAARRAVVHTPRETFPMQAMEHPRSCFVFSHHVRFHAVAGRILSVVPSVEGAWVGSTINTKLFGSFCVSEVRHRIPHGGTGVNAKGTKNAAQPP